MKEKSSDGPFMPLHDSLLIDDTFLLRATMTALQADERFRDRLALLCAHPHVVPPSVITAGEDTRKVVLSRLAGRWLWQTQRHAPLIVRLSLGWYDSLNPEPGRFYPELYVHWKPKLAAGDCLAAWERWEGRKLWALMEQFLGESGVIRHKTAMVPTRGTEWLGQGEWKLAETEELFEPGTGPDNE